MSNGKELSTALACEYALARGGGQRRGRKLSTRLVPQGNEVDRAIIRVDQCSQTAKNELQALAEVHIRGFLVHLLGRMLCDAGQLLTYGRRRSHSWSRPAPVEPTCNSGGPACTGLSRAQRGGRHRSLEGYAIVKRIPRHQTGRLPAIDKQRSYGGPRQGRSMADADGNLNHLRSPVRTYWLAERDSSGSTWMTHYTSQHGELAGYGRA